MRYLRLFENFDKSINEGAIKKLWMLIDGIKGNPDLDPGTQWTPEEALEWGVGFAREYGLWHPDDTADTVSWSDKTPSDLEKANKQMENFSNADWKSSGMGADLDQYVVAMFISNVVNNQTDNNAWIKKPEYKDEVDALIKVLESNTSDRYVVMNLTDGIYASPDVMSKSEAEQFIKDFPKRFKAAGYYLTANRERIDPLDVKLEMQPAEEDDQPTGDYEAAENISLAGAVGNFKLQAGDKINVKPGKLPTNYTVKTPKGVSEISMKSIEDLVATGKLKEISEPF